MTSLAQTVGGYPVGRTESNAGDLIVFPLNGRFVIAVVVGQDDGGMRYEYDDGPRVGTCVAWGDFEMVLKPFTGYVAKRSLFQPETVELIGSSYRSLEEAYAALKARLAPEAA